MKIKEINKLSKDELKSKLGSIKKDLFNSIVINIPISETNANYIEMAKN